ncbi:MAG: hypothetical protein KDD53_07255, partial [Bdellovibrionales bacterium]|nr:hypothetical protein [Bdellovibrionales bacterium]
AKSDKVLFQTDPHIVEVFHLQQKTGEDFRFTSNYRNLQFIQKGTVLARLGKHVMYRAPEDCYIILPTPPELQKVGEEVYLLARRVGAHI